MKIREIEIKNFRGFYNAHPIDLGRSGKNALIYGENGSGKSSLFQALKQFISSDPSEDGYVKLTCDNGKSYEWSSGHSFRSKRSFLACMG
ncbi:MAG: AAA family ATPase [Prochlorotrichaceae cyanobacterium]|jgi:AAA15 family ATPase/GTPase